MYRWKPARKIRLQQISRRLLARVISGSGSEPCYWTVGVSYTVVKSLKVRELHFLWLRSNHSDRIRPAFWKEPNYLIGADSLTWGSNRGGQCPWYVVKINNRLDTSYVKSRPSHVTHPLCHIFSLKPDFWTPLKVPPENNGHDTRGCNRFS